MVFPPGPPRREGDDRNALLASGGKGEISCIERSFGSRERGICQLASFTDSDCGEIQCRILANLYSNWCREFPRLEWRPS